MGEGQGFWGTRRELLGGVGTKPRGAYRHGDPLHGRDDAADVLPGHCGHALLEVLFVWELEGNQQNGADAVSRSGGISGSAAGRTVLKNGSQIQRTGGRRAILMP